MLVVSASSRTIGRRTLLNTRSTRIPVPCWTTTSSSDANSTETDFRSCLSSNTLRGRAFSSQQQPSINPNTRQSSTSNSSRKRNVVTLQSTSSDMENILHRIKKMELSSTKDDVTNLMDDVRNVMDSLIFAVKNGQLNPSGKHGKGISDIIERILRAYHRISHLSHHVTPCFDNCQEALDALQFWNLNCQNSHYNHIIAVANKEQRWKEAANLFFKQIDPEAAFNPVPVSISDPQGLYAVVRLAQQEESAVADLVFDAVMQLSMVSPQDQSTYVLAAGTALGKAGEWESAREFLNTSYSASQLGQPLISSVMQACLLSEKPEEALSIFEHKIGSADKQSIAKEWQWGGNADTLDPVVRDLVMRASWARDGGSTLALQLFHDTLEEGVTISDDALLGILKACEHDRNLEGCLSVFNCILDDVSSDNWIVPGLELAIYDRESDGAKLLSNGTVASRWLPEMSHHLASILRTCNSVSSFGTGLFYIRRLDLAMHESNVESTTLTIHDITPSKSIAQSLTKSVLNFKGKSELFIPIMTSLCGLRCYDDALRFYDFLGDVALLEDQNLDPTSIIRDYIRSEMAKNGQTIIGNPWISADRHIHRVTSALHVVRKTKLTKEERRKILKGLAAAMQCCTNAHQPDLSLRLLSFVAKDLQPDSSQGRRFLGDEKQSWREMITVDDSLTAEIIHSLGWTNNLMDAVEIFQSVLRQEAHRLSKWRSTCSAGLLALAKLGRGNEAFEIFQEMDKTKLSAECYNGIGKHLYQTGNTKELGILYNLALNSGNLSEDLSLMTMAAVSKSKIDNRVRVLRAMVDDNATYVGVSREKWMETRYWNVRRELGFKNARILMWWNNAETCHLDELNFAITDFNSRKREGLRVRNDVLRVIVNNARRFSPRDIPDDFSNWNLVPRTREQWTELLLKVIEESSSSPISYDASFIDGIVAALRHIGATSECVAYFSAVLNRDVRVQTSTLTNALEAATVEDAVRLASDIRMFILEGVE